MHLTKRYSRETGRDYALRSIKDNIIRLELAPGSMVSENELASELGLSRTPVREALIELSKVKIVEIYPQKGSVVSLIDYSMVEESQFMRKVLECAVVELNCSMATADDIKKLEENVKLQNFYLENYSPEMLMELDSKFHGLMFEVAHKSQIYTLMENILIHFDRVRSMALITRKNTGVVDEHKSIVDAIARRDAQCARKLMEHHLCRYKLDEKAIREKYPDYFKQQT